MKMSIKITDKSITSVLGRLKSKKANVDGAAKQAIEETTKNVFDKAQENVAVQTGALKASGRTHIGGTKDYRIGKIGYGDSSVGAHGVATAIYAPIRHEMDIPKNPQSYKWLERALLSSNEEFRNEAIKLIKAAIEK